MAMKYYTLKFPSIIEELENANRWDILSKIVYENWLKCPNDIDLLLCAGTELWYAILIMNYHENDPNPPKGFVCVSVDELQSKLMTVTRYGFEHFAEDAAFQAYFGYMIKTMPYFFLDYQGDYVGWEEKGIAMMKKSYTLDPNSPFTKAMNFEMDDYKDQPYYNACCEIWEQISQEEWGNSKVSKYFYRILWGPEQEAQ